MENLDITLSWVFENCGAQGVAPELLEQKHQIIKGFSTDSRTLEQGQVFVALVGPKFDGHDHLDEVMAKGALAVIASKAGAGRSVQAQIKVSDTLAALGDLAHALRERQELKVIALTGSNGKTTTKEMVAAIMSQVDENILATRGNFNNLVGLPLTIFNVEPKARYAVLEMGMNHFGEIARLTEIADPDVALITSVGPAHLEFFGTVERVAEAKGELFQGLKASAVAVVNSDEPLLMRESRRFSGNKLYFGSGPEAQIRVEQVKNLGLDGQTFTLYGPGAEKGCPIVIQLLGQHNVNNALAAAAVSLATGASWDQIQLGLSQVKNYPGRLAPFMSQSGLLIIDDSYNANPASVSAGLMALAGLNNPVKGAILGDMLELGEVEAKSHCQIGQLVAQLKLDFLAAVGPLSRDMARAARKAGLPFDRVAEFDTPLQAAEWVSRVAGPGAAVLIKGSRSMKLEGAVDYFKK